MNNLPNVHPISITDYLNLMHHSQNITISNKINKMNEDLEASGVSDLEENTKEHELDEENANITPTYYSKSNIPINMDTINKYVVFINPQNEDIIYLPKIFTHVFNYDCGELIDVNSIRKLTLNSLQVYLSKKLNPNIFKQEFNKIKYWKDIDDIDLILEMIIENGIVRKSLKYIETESIIKDYEPDLIVHVDKTLDRSFTSVIKYETLIVDNLLTLHSANNVKIQLYNIVFEIKIVNSKTLKDLYLTLYEYYIHILSLKDLQKLPFLSTLNHNEHINNIKLENSRIEWNIDNTLYVKIIPSLFNIKDILVEIEHEISMIK